MKQIILSNASKAEGEPSEITHTATTGAEPVTMNGFMALRTVSVYVKAHIEGSK